MSLRKRLEKVESPLKHQWERAWATWLTDATRTWPKRGILFDESGTLHPRAEQADALGSALIEDIPELGPVAVSMT